jgi:hypothetical protein
MRKIIFDPSDARRSIAIEADTICDLVVLELDGRSATFSPDVARRIGKWLLHAASMIDRPPIDHDIDPDLDPEG